MTTIRELSRRLGLSVSTVSKALNGYKDISPETRDRVAAVAGEMGYHPNALARALKTNRTYNLGVLFVDDDLSGLTHNYFAAVLDSFKVEAERGGYDITFINHNIGKSRMTYLEHCRYRNVDGVCLACVDFGAEEVVQLAMSDIPLVIIDHLFDDRSCILSENRQGMEMLVRYIHGRGHRRIAYLHGHRSTVSDQRVKGFLETMAELGLEVPEGYLRPSPYHEPAAAYQAVKRVLELPERPDCIIMPDDYAALGGIEALAEAALRIPEDISVAGYDGVKLIGRLKPQLTTVEQDTLRIGQEAARQLLKLIEHPRTARAEIVNIACRLIPGETVRDLKE
ncbi:LacI family DNA-binding transcriptional regulator [Bacillota bacterium Meth-B3]|nr:LacI family DNA-binding transcriptional regulator [Christensenellaceae bacterium]